MPDAVLLNVRSARLGESDGEVIVAQSEQLEVIHIGPGISGISFVACLPKVRVSHLPALVGHLCGVLVVEQTFHHISMVDVFIQILLQRLYTSSLPQIINFEIDLFTDRVDSRLVLVLNSR